MVRRLLFLGLAVAMATTAFATSGDYSDVVIPTDESTWEGEQPANFLLIQDQQGWGFNTWIEILNNNGVPYDVINSGSIGATDFGPYDKILTPGQQPDNFYFAIQNNQAKFEGYMGEGGCVTFETANYFGYPNEQITWPGGFMAVINGGSNTLQVDTYDNCLMEGVNEAELQGWNYSAHGIHTNLPGGHVSVLTTLDGSPNGSCAGWFPLGSGGAFITHQPNEWGYGFGFSPNYVPNLALCTCGEPTATETTSWGSVKALYK